MTDKTQPAAKGKTARKRKPPVRRFRVEYPITGSDTMKIDAGTLVSAEDVIADIDELVRRGAVTPLEGKEQDDG